MNSKNSENLTHTLAKPKGSEPNINVIRDFVKQKALEFTDNPTDKDIEQKTKELTLKAKALYSNYIFKGMTPRMARRKVNRSAGMKIY